MITKIKKKLYLLRKVHFTNFFRLHYAQFGEDIIIRELIKKDPGNGFYVDVGCYHPKKFSNTYRLYKRGWRGINVDMDGLKIEAFNVARPDDINVNACVSDKSRELKAFSFSKYGLGSTIDDSVASNTKESVYSVRTITTVTLNEIIRETPYRDRQIDLLSIDAEGHDFNVLKSLDIDLYRPKLILIEHLTADIDNILKCEIYSYLTSKGYRLINWVGPTLFFLLPDNDIFGPIADVADHK
ncbi:MAG TPA: FkbM family methyltransferase [Dissulfurispiraceae bacterium]|nr:FkbM family methyltransferase [Dissulfurispiraceae bacterium]